MPFGIAWVHHIAHKYRFRRTNLRLRISKKLIQAHNSPLNKRILTWSIKKVHETNLLFQHPWEPHLDKSDVSGTKKRTCFAIMCAKRKCTPSLCPTTKQWSRSKTPAMSQSQCTLQTLNPCPPIQSILYLQFRWSRTTAFTTLCAHLSTSCSVNSPGARHPKQKIPQYPSARWFLIPSPVAVWARPVHTPENTVLPFKYVVAPFSSCCAVPL